MGLSSKQVSNRGLDWNQTLLQAQDLELPKPTLMRKQQQQQTQQQSEPLKCPRCDSTNTKFCYYNNYNKSQPRHFCRACKRHWTKGGTLRNVPVGGGRKNKRVIKKSSNSSTTTTSNGNINMDVSELGAHMTIQTPHQRSQNLSAVGDQKNTPLPSSLYQSLIHHPPPLVPQQNLMSNKESSEEGKEEFGIGNGIFLSSAVPFPQQNQTPLFPFSTSLRSSNVYNYGEEEINKIVEEPTINNNIMPSSTSGTITQPWEIPATTRSTTAMLGTSNYWSWEDIDSLVSTDLNVPWDDSDIKP